MNEKDIVVPLISPGFYDPDDPHMPDDLTHFPLPGFFRKKNEVSAF